MKEDKKEYYGIRFNGKIPEKDEINEFNKEVEITFLGKAYLVERKDEKIEKTEIENYYRIEEEGEYEIEFVNKQNFIYNLNIRIRKSCLFFILLFIIGLLLLALFFMPLNNEQPLLKKFLSLIDISVLQVDINEDEPEIKYVFDVDFENIISREAELSNSMNAKAVAKNKIAPGVSGEFSIIISTKGSNVDMRYSVDFQDITKDKPNNLLFKIKGQVNEFSSLQELEKYLIGTAKKGAEKEIVIEWRWPYEIDSTQDSIDTDNGINLENYKFKINVNGEEAI